MDLYQVDDTCLSLKFAVEDTGMFHYIPDEGTSICI